MKKVRILSLDGGGIRGVIPAVVIAHIEKVIIEKTQNPNARIADYFDLVVGTSTGGILTCIYLMPPEANSPTSSLYPAEKAFEFYAEKGYDIFNQSKKKDFFGLRQLFNATQYQPSNIERIFKEEFGDLKMNDLVKPSLVTTYDMNKRTAYFFSSREDTSKRDFYVRDVARSTSAAPTYFPPAEIENLATSEKMVNIDGGIFANNPTMCAYSEARHLKFDQKDCPTAKDMLILSVGTGAGRFELENVDSSPSWGVLNWAKSMPNIMMDASADTVHYQIGKIFETLLEKDQLNYKRIDVPSKLRDTIGYSRDMADASKKNILLLKEAGEAAIEGALHATDKSHSLSDFVDLLIGESIHEEPLVS